MEGEAYSFSNGVNLNLNESSKNQTLSINSNSNDYSYDETLSNYRTNVKNNEYVDFLYSVYNFERTIYLYIWEFLVIVTFLINVLVIWVLLQKKLRSVTNMILVAIAISDSMMGLVTLPSYIMVYTISYPKSGNADNFNMTYMYDDYYTYDDYLKSQYYGEKHHREQPFFPVHDKVYDDITNDDISNNKPHGDKNQGEQNSLQFHYPIDDNPNVKSYGEKYQGQQNNISVHKETKNDYLNNDYSNSEYFGRTLQGQQENSSHINTQNQIGERDSYQILLSKSLCEGFMVSKYFLSRSFHTVSVWLTLFLGIQRFISVTYPFQTQAWFKTRNTLIICVSIAIMAPVLHTYHLVNEKAVDGYCTWKLRKGHVGDTSHLWATSLLQHIIPCILLTITTILFVRHLNNNPMKKRSTSTRVFSGNEVRADENRRVSRIVIAIVIAFLIAEVPYAIFLLFVTIFRHTNAHDLVDLKRNRAFHAGYEIAVVLSYQMNFYIYTFLNRRFRQQLINMWSCVEGSVRNLGFSSNRSGQQTTNGATKSETLSNTADKSQIVMKSYTSDGTINQI